MKGEQAGLVTSGRIDRRHFVGRCVLGGITVFGAQCGFPAGSNAGKSQPIAFNTANLVGRVTGYRYELRDWMEQHAKTVAAMDDREWRSICGEIAASGFKAVEVWEAHASPGTLDEARAMEWKAILLETGLKPVAYAGTLSPATARICRWLEIPHIDGGLGELSPEQATALCRETGIRCNIENHPEKSADEILAKIDGGNEWLGVCIDIGWLGTQGVSGPEVIRACGPFVRHTHVKDVKNSGGHETCLLGDGVAEVAESLKALRDVGYSGAYSWEDEPEDRNPFDSAARNREWIEQRV